MYCSADCGCLTRCGKTNKETTKTKRNPIKEPPKGPKRNPRPPPPPLHVPPPTRPPPPPTPPPGFTCGDWGPGRRSGQKPRPAGLLAASASASTATAKATSPSVSSSSSWRKASLLASLNSLSCLGGWGGWGGVGQGGGVGGGINQRWTGSHQHRKPPVGRLIGVICGYVCSGKRQKMHQHTPQAKTGG